jgi:hypothetical protein
MFGSTANVVNVVNIVVELENNGILSPGARLIGRVVLNVLKEVLAECLTLTFYGTEKNYVQTEEQSFYEDVVIFNISSVLDTFGEIPIRPNQYTYLFDIPIPPHVPGTQKYKGGSYGETYAISYHCEAVLHRKGMFTWIAKYASEVTIYDQPYVSAPTKMYIGPVASDATFKFGGQRGTIMFGAVVNTTYATPNQTLRLNYAIRNMSRSHIKSLVISLRRVVWLVAQGHSRVHLNIIFEKRIEVRYLPGASPIDSGNGNGNGDYNAFLRQINDGEFGLDIPIGDIDLPTLSSRLTRVRYEIRVKIKTSFGTANNNIKIPIIMNRKSSPYNPVRAECDQTVINAAQVAIEVEEEEKKVDIISPDNRSGGDKAGVVAEVVAGTSGDIPGAPCRVEYDTVDNLRMLLKGCHELEEINVLRDWLAHSPNNINLVTPDALRLLYQCIKGNYTFYTFSRELGEAMSQVTSSNKCTCRHIAEAASGAKLGSKVPVINTFAPYCVDRENARFTFSIMGELDEEEMKEVMRHYF